MRASSWRNAVLLAAGTNPYALLETATVAAARHSGTAQALHAKALPPHIDSFGWCSWDAFYSAVSAAGLDEAVRGLKSRGTPPRWLIIDDGWQCTDVDAAFRKDPLRLGEADRGREAFVEGEVESLEFVARGVPAAGPTGAVLREVRGLTEDARGTGSKRTGVAHDDADDAFQEEEESFDGRQGATKEEGIEVDIADRQGVSHNNSSAMRRRRRRGQSKSPGKSQAAESYDSEVLALQKAGGRNPEPRLGQRPWRSTFLIGYVMWSGSRGWSGSWLLMEVVALLSMETFVIMASCRNDVSPPQGPIPDVPSHPFQAYQVVAGPAGVLGGPLDGFSFFLCHLFIRVRGGSCSRRQLGSPGLALGLSRPASRVLAPVYGRQQ